MERALLDFPLALFSTLAPIGAGGFIALALAFFTTDFSDEQLRKIDKLSVIPFAFVVLGFLLSLFHLTSVFKTTNIFLGLETSPLSREILVAALFAVLALIYCIIAFAGKFSKGARKGFSALVAFAGIIFALFIGRAYMMDTIASWNTSLVPLEILGFCLFGGALLGTFILALADSLEDAKQTRFKTFIFILTLIGAGLAVTSVLLHVAMIGELNTSVVSGDQLISEVLIFVVLFVVGAAVAFTFQYFALFKKKHSHSYWLKRSYCCSRYPYRTVGVLRS